MCLAGIRDHRARLNAFEPVLKEGIGILGLDDGAPSDPVPVLGHSGVQPFGSNASAERAQEDTDGAGENANGPAVEILMHNWKLLEHFINICSRNNEYEKYYSI